MNITATLQNVAVKRLLFSILRKKITKGKICMREKPLHILQYGSNPTMRTISNYMNDNFTHQLPV